MNIEILTTRVNQTLQNQIAALSKQITEIDEQLIPVSKSLSQFLAEGKRFRPIFALLGFIGADGELNEATYKAVCALEFIQASALIHDDLMDASDTRRGKPAVHKQFATLHGAAFGASAAILIGDLALIWSEQVLQESGLSSEVLMRTLPVFQVMRNELMAGQFLDIFEQTQESFSIERSLKIARYKSGKYSIERPLHFGAALSAKCQSPQTLENYHQIYSEYGLPLGEAFQLRDDLLGVFGDPTMTGKPAGDDLREGKRTALVAFAFDRGSKATRQLLSSKLGTPLSDADLETLRSAILESGAVAHVEDLIERLAESALDALERDEINTDGKNLLASMVTAVTKRER